jgi:hypothetical protein
MTTMPTAPPLRRLAFTLLLGGGEWTLQYCKASLAECGGENFAPSVRTPLLDVTMRT